MFHTTGDADLVAAYDALLLAHADHWLVREITLYWKRTLKRVDGGDYGYCVDTGEEIGLDRLEARPQAERTIDAQERWEHSQKLMGD